MNIYVWYICIYTYLDGFVQDCSNSIANALELLQSYTKPSIYLYGLKLFFSESLTFPKILSTFISTGSWIPFSRKTRTCFSDIVNIHGYWWCGDMGSQGISVHSIGLVFEEYSSLNTRKVRDTWHHMGQVMELRLSCYLVLLSIDSKTR